MKFDNVFSQKILKYALLTSIGLCSTELASAGVAGSPAVSGYPLKATVCLVDQSIPAQTSNVEGFFGLQPNTNPCPLVTVVEGKDNPNPPASTMTIPVRGTFNNQQCVTSINLRFAPQKQLPYISLDKFNIFVSNEGVCHAELGSGTLPPPPMTNPLYEQQQPSSD